MRFIEKLCAAWERSGSLLCVGLDPDPALMPVDDVVAFNRAVIEATADLVCAYKPNAAFYEAMGRAGYDALKATAGAMPAGVVSILDAKRGDIGNTAKAYARAAFDDLGFDAVTVNPYLGADSVEPFIERPDRGAFVVCRTSNPGAADLQNLLVSTPDGARPLYEVVALAAQEWSRHENVGIVAGATYPDDIRRLRQLCPSMPFLAPGVGSQQGDVGAAVRAGMDGKREGLIINAARSIIYAGSGPRFADAVRAAAQGLRDEINASRAAPAGRGA